MHREVHFAPPPRPVPLSLVLSNLFNGMSQFGWLFFGFGMVFVWVFAAEADLSIDAMRELEVARGQVTQVEETPASEDKQAVYANYYAFFVDGRRHTGVSYITGDPATVGQEVEIEYDQSDPTWSRIAGMRRAMFGPWVLLMLLFPIIGLTLVFFALRRGLLRARLLRDGHVATGKLIAKKATNTTVNKRRVFALTFEFTGRDGRRHVATTRTSFPHHLEDEADEPLLYDPEDPSRVYLLDELPARPRIDDFGQLVGQPLAATLLLIIPSLAIGTHLLVALRRWF